jgi:hypothetical protein
MKKSKLVLSLGAALASLTGIVPQPADAKANASEPKTDSLQPAADRAEQAPANAYFQFGEDLLGFVVTMQPDGTIVAGHSSHASHASHSSHASHASSRH